VPRPSYTPDKLNNALRLHKQWLSSNKEGPTANLQGADIFDVSLEGENLQDINLEGSNFRRSNFRGTILVGANLQRSVFFKAVLVRANLKGADLSKADLNNADLRGANLCDLKGIMFEEASDGFTAGTDFHTAKINSKTLENVTYGWSN
jgi:uncharacterized protein YjbI with pentapeptide repeats